MSEVRVLRKRAFQAEGLQVQRPWGKGTFGVGVDETEETGRMRGEVEEHDEDLVFALS